MLISHMPEIWSNVPPPTLQIQFVHGYPFNTAINKSQQTTENQIYTHWNVHGGLEFFRKYFCCNLIIKHFCYILKKLVCWRSLGLSSNLWPQQQWLNHQTVRVYHYRIICPLAAGCSKPISPSLCSFWRTVTQVFWFLHWLLLCVVGKKWKLSCV